MAGGPGLRERKKARTRRTLIEAAVRLFESRGYEETTLADIAAAADVSTRTFFSYFAGKEDVVFFDTRRRVERALAVIAGRRAGEQVSELLRRVANEALRPDPEEAELALELYAARTRLVMTVPALQARALHVLFEVQREMADALLRSCPGELDAIEAAAAVGALVGAIKQAVMAARDRGDPPELMWDAGRRGIDIALCGLHSLDGRHTPGADLTGRVI
ncbi:TetR family transcriptional regulator [Sphaerisporangium melleum]|uniref:TetR family transcriptional regulator n=1 Tax=Sphaerisporangium melleum TaxID=321316 RepID=A0A917RGR6_9ACTN|nr:TetR/AcrR family transcriptional regulator [Sphaerisporangium melleum]GGL07419.1 TetR family transcriptional regulator [Sphaerisporangium melleum]GII68695.1 TetR family transcriptional regulator [Sphaerisporangium melleum]